MKKIIVCLIVACLIGCVSIPQAKRGKIIMLNKEVIEFNNCNINVDEDCVYIYSQSSTRIIMKNQIKEMHLIFSDYNL
jgi:hypothetical protein